MCRNKHVSDVLLRSRHVVPERVMAKSEERQRRSVVVELLHACVHVCAREYVKCRHARKKTHCQSLSRAAHTRLQLAGLILDALVPRVAR